MHRGSDQRTPHCRPAGSLPAAPPPAHRPAARRPAARGHDARPLLLSPPAALLIAATGYRLPFASRDPVGLHLGRGWAPCSTGASLASMLQHRLFMLSVPPWQWHQARADQSPPVWLQRIKARPPHILKSLTQSSTTQNRKQTGMNKHRWRKYGVSERIQAGGQSVGAPHPTKAANEAAGYSWAAGGSSPPESLSAPGSGIYSVGNTARSGSAPSTMATPFCGRVCFGRNLSRLTTSAT